MGKKAWQAAPLCLFWTVWKERNSRVFHDKGIGFKGLSSLFFDLWGWVNMFIVSKAISFVDFVYWLGTP